MTGGWIRVATVMCDGAEAGPTAIQLRKMGRGHKEKSSTKPIFRRGGGENMLNRYNFSVWDAIVTEGGTRIGPLP